MYPGDSSPADCAMGCLGTPSPMALQWLLKGSDIPPLRRDQKTRRAPSAGCRLSAYSHLDSRKPAYLFFEQVAKKSPASIMFTVCARTYFHQSPTRIRGIHAIIRCSEARHQQLRGAFSKWPRMHSDWDARSEIHIASRIHSLWNIGLKRRSETHY